MSKVFRPWKTDEVWLLPPSVADFVPAGHPAHLVRDLVSGELDLSAIMGAYTEVKGYPPYHPAMMVALLLYAYRSGVYSSRRIARACEERLDFRAVTALNQPDFRTIREFRRRHLDALVGLFVQVLALCRKAGRAGLGHVAVDSAEGFNDRVRRTVAGVFHHISSHHADLYFNEIGLRWSQRVLTGHAMRRTRKGRDVIKPLWSRIAPALQLSAVFRSAVGR
jgi:transposase